MEGFAASSVSSGLNDSYMSKTECLPEQNVYRDASMASNKTDETQELTYKPKITERAQR